MDDICSRDPITPMSGVKIFVAGADVWRPVLGYEGFYEVSGHGQVRALARTITYASGITRTYAPRMMDQKPQKNGRRLVNLSAGDGTNRQTHVSILVLEAFQGARPAGKEAAHRNDDSGDDRLSNLHWATHQENCDERAQNGKDADARKTHCVNGHLLAGENLKIVSDRPGKFRRRCVTCDRNRNRESARDRRANAKAARQSED